ncbi:MAG: hypothetical protein FD168_914 [Desulfobulbaceae bacterium]|jgi:hypothetical protein|nr:MAG: hypothetical protein FD168_914 [Desulfobulbaceae bacterium]
MGKAKRAHMPASAQGIDGHGLSAFGVSTSFRLPAHPTFFYTSAFSLGLRDLSRVRGVYSGSHEIQGSKARGDSEGWYWMRRREPVKTRA